MTVFVIFTYLALVLIVGTVSHRFFRGTGEDYFVASRSIGPFVLLMSLVLIDSLFTIFLCLLLHTI